jgi:thiamine-phosphate pyrophosphorylase
VGARKGPLPPLFLISDVERLGEARFLHVLEEAIRSGLGMVQLREPSWGEDRVRALVASVRALLARENLRRPLLLVNRRPALALELALDGIHVGGGDPSEVARCRSVAGEELLVGYSAHSLREIGEAERAGADYVTYSPIFGAISKRHVLPAVGLEGLKEACVAATIPVFALGGITPQHALALRDAGAAGAAMMGSILDAPEPVEAVREFLRLWREPR